MGTISQKLEYLATTKTKIKDTINLTGAGLTTEPFRQYAVKLKDAYVDIINNGTETLYNNFPKVSGTGESMELSNTYEAPMQIDLKGNTSQEGTPTPDNPQDIHNVSGNNSIVVCGKNLFDKTESITTGKTYLDDGTLGNLSTAFVQESYIKVKPNEYYTLSTTNDYSGDNNFRIQICEYDENKTFIKRNSGTYNTGVRTSYTIQLGTNTKYVRIGGMNNLIDELQLEGGSTATTYEAYNGTTYPINLPIGIELSKIGTYQDYIYKENDKWYLHKEIYKYVFDGTENWRADSGTQGTDYRHNISISSTYLNVPKPINIDKTYISNYFSQQTIYDDVGVLGVFYCNNNWFVFPDKNKVYDLAGFKTWLSTHNTSVYYVLATPTNTEITDSTLLSQLETIYNAKSKNGTTNILQTNNDLSFIITASALEKGQ